MSQRQPENSSSSGPLPTIFLRGHPSLYAAIACVVTAAGLHYALESGKSSDEFDLVEVSAIVAEGERLPAAPQVVAPAPLASKVPAQPAAQRPEHRAPRPTATTAEQQQVARFIATRYRLAHDQTQELVGHAYRVSREAKVDPWLVLAVIAVESSFNPKAQSHKGAQGLMQVLTRVHREKFAPFGGPGNAFDPLVNMRVGTQILKQYLVRAGGSVEGALKSYVGAALLPHDGGYGKKVLTERARIAAAATGRIQPNGIVVARADRTRVQTPASTATGSGTQRVSVTMPAAPRDESSGASSAKAGKGAGVPPLADSDSFRDI